MQFINAKGHIIFVSHLGTQLQVKPQGMINLPEDVGLAHGLSSLEGTGAAPQPVPKESAQPVAPKPSKPKFEPIAPPPEPPFEMTPAPITNAVEIVPAPMPGEVPPPPPSDLKPAVPPGEAAGRETVAPETIADAPETTNDDEDAKKLAEMIAAAEPKPEPAIEDPTAILEPLAKKIDEEVLDDLKEQAQIILATDGIDAEKELSSAVAEKISQEAVIEMPDQPVDPDQPVAEEAAPAKPKAKKSSKPKKEKKDATQQPKPAPGRGKRPETQ